MISKLKPEEGKGKGDLLIYYLVDNVCLHCSYYSRMN